MFTKEDVGAVLRALRIKSGMTQKEVAERIGRKQQVIGHWETGYAQPDANTLFSLCTLFNTTVDEAFGFGIKQEHLTPTGQRIGRAYDKAPQREQGIVEHVLEPYLEDIPELKKRTHHRK